MSSSFQLPEIQMPFRPFPKLASKQILDPSHDERLRFSPLLLTNCAWTIISIYLFIFYESNLKVELVITLVVFTFALVGHSKIKCWASSRKCICKPKEGSSFYEWDVSEVGKLRLMGYLLCAICKNKLITSNLFILERAGFH